MYKYFYCSYPNLQVQCTLTIDPSFPALFHIRSLLAIALTFAFRTTYLPASQVEEKTVLAYVLLKVVVGLLLHPGSQLQCCIVNMPVLEMKYEIMPPYSFCRPDYTVTAVSVLNQPLRVSNKAGCTDESR